ncbi:hypothetical protein LL912_14890 [Niabella sp. CC-SYL272]|uniref:hypothetical protein n=1 Tax=Niabella agricola TaxID=2891571 RepID=UPI001F238532|nr:hypothetical protein [Niabella agricola]MCF3110066.1 hypothetical protein [Niabella agricola]
MKYEEYVIRSVLCNNAYGIKEVNEWTTLEYLVFDFDRYPEVKPLIAVGDIVSIRLLNADHANHHLGRYLSILRLSDQEQRNTSSPFLIVLL